VERDGPERRELRELHAAGELHPGDAMT